MFSHSSTQYRFPLKNTNGIGIIELVTTPSMIDQGLSRDVLVNSFIGEYQQYLKPEEISQELISWQEGDHSVRKYYENYFTTELAEFEQGDIHYWVTAKINGELAGWATFLREKSDKRALYMNLLIVDPDHQHQGVGEQLVKSLVKLGVMPDASAINILLRKKNKGGREFYSKLGFESNPDYQRSENFVDLALLEALTWNNPALLHENQYAQSRDKLTY